MGTSLDFDVLVSVCSASDVVPDTITVSYRVMYTVSVVFSVGVGRFVGRTLSDFVISVVTNSVVAPDGGTIVVGNTVTSSV